MKGSIIIDKVKQQELQRQWHLRLAELNRALKRLIHLRHQAMDEFAELEYIEAVMEFSEARDNERNFFWDAFVRKEKSTTKI